jgi:uncharacterized protein (TIGR00369 family)
MTTDRSRTITWTDPTQLAAAAGGRTGLAYLRAIASGELPQAPISMALDFRIVAADEGLARFEGTPGELQYNPMATVHGGWVCTLLDSAMSCAVLSVLDTETAYTTAQLNVHLLRAITAATGPVVAEGRLLHRGKRLATADGTLRDRAGTLLAHATTTCAILPR